MRFLRASDPNISLDEVLQGFSSDDSSSLSDATLILDENQARFLAAQSLCATITIFHRMGLPNLSSTLEAQHTPPILALNPILIDPEVRAPTGIELVPWKPSVPAALLQYWPVVFEDLQRVSFATREPLTSQAAPIILTDGTQNNPSSSSSRAVVSFSEECTNIYSDPRPSSPGPSSATTAGAITPAIQKKRGSTRASLPIGVSNLAIPIAATSVRRSARLNKHDGFCVVRLDREPAKKRKISITQIDEHTGKMKVLVWFW
jgi:hypothetical protein